MDADLNKHKSWSSAQQCHKREMDKLNRGMFRPHSCRLSYQAHWTSAGTKCPSMQTLLCHIRPLYRAVHICSKCVYTLIFSFRPVCINRGLKRVGLCSLSCSYKLLLPDLNLQWRLRHLQVRWPGGQSRWPSFTLLFLVARDMCFSFQTLSLIRINKRPKFELR